MEMSDEDRARELFERIYYADADTGIVCDAVNHKAVALLKSDPDEYFRLARIWRELSVWRVPADDGSGIIEIRPVTITPPVPAPRNCDVIATQRQEKHGND